MRWICTLNIFIFLLMGCSSDGAEELPLLPREYYRSIISVDDIGAAFSKNQEATDGLVPLIINHERISEAVLITHEGETIVGLRFNPYYRNISEEIKEEIAAITTVEVTNIIDDPRKYRILERLSKEKELGNISELWLQEWSMILDE